MKREPCATCGCPVLVEPGFKSVSCANCYKKGTRMKVKRSKPPVGGSKDRRAKQADGPVELPKDYTEPENDINAFSLLIHGEKKIGKTTLSLQGGRVLVLQCDPPQKAYRRLEIVCNNWKKFLGAIKSLEQATKLKKFPYDRVVLDAADLWYHMCMQYACEKLCISHPEDESYGKGWAAVRYEFTQAVDRLLRLPCGTWFLAHSAWREVVRRDKTKVEKLLPRLGGQAEEILNGKVDGWFGYDYDGDNRILLLRGSETVGAGHRIDTEENPHFRWAGESLMQIPMGKSPKDAYKNLTLAFDNKFEPEQKARKIKKGKKRIKIRKKKLGY